MRTERPGDSVQKPFLIILQLLPVVHCLPHRYRLAECLYSCWTPLPLLILSIFPPKLSSVFKSSPEEVRCVPKPYDEDHVHPAFLHHIAPWVYPTP